MFNPINLFSIRLGCVHFAIKIEIRDLWCGVFWDVRGNTSDSFHVHLFFLPFPIFPLFHTRVTVRKNSRSDRILCFVLCAVHFLVLCYYVSLVLRGVQWIIQ